MKRSIFLIIIVFCSFVLLGCDAEKEQKEAFEKAQQTNTVEAYSEFIKEYKDSELASDAKAKLDELNREQEEAQEQVRAEKSEQEESSFAKAKESKSVAELEKFITENPNGQMVEAAKKEIRDLICASPNKAQKPTFLALAKAVDMTYSPETCDVMFKKLLGLQELDLSGSGIFDLTPLASLVRARKLNLEKNNIKDISPLKNLVSLTELRLNQNKFTDLAPLRGLRRLNSLFIGSNRIGSISPLQGLTGLKVLYFENNRVTDLNPIGKLVNLRALSFKSNRVKDISALEPLVKIRKLNLRRNEVADISPLKGMTNMTHLYLLENVVSAGVDQLVSMKVLEKVDLTKNDNIPCGQLDALKKEFKKEVLDLPKKCS